MPTLSIEPNERVGFRVVHRADAFLVVDKPAGVVTQPGVGHQHDTLLNGLFARFGPELQNLGKARDFGLVHRLDRETSGLLAVALTAPAYDALRAAFAARRVKKFYHAVTDKAPREPEGVIRKNLDEVEERKDRYTHTVHAKIARGGKPAVTAYRVLATADTGEALIEARPITGRLHQVRCHLASIGAGILGDRVYGPRRTDGAAARLALHAHRLAFELDPADPDPADPNETEPDANDPEPISIDARSKMPKDMRGLCRRIGLPIPD